MNTDEKQNRILARIGLVITACAVLGIVAVTDWKLESGNISERWRDYVLFGACAWTVIAIAFWTRLRAKQIKIVFLALLALYWPLGAAITSYGLSFIWLPLLALTEVSILITFSRRAKETG
jgi:hypothetical protein